MGGQNSCLFFFTRFSCNLKAAHVETANKKVYFVFLFVCLFVCLYFLGANHYYSFGDRL